MSIREFGKHLYSILLLLRYTDSNLMVIRKTDSGQENSDYPLYPHRFEDLVFIIYQRGKLKDEVPRSSTKPIVQWIIFIFIAAIILFVLRKVFGRNEQLSHRINSDTAPDYFLGSFVDSTGVFLGIGLNRIGNSRAERWFLISFSVFGLLFNMIYTEYLFATFTAIDNNRITSIDQLLKANIPITVDDWATLADGDFYIRIRS